MLAEELTLTVFNEGIIIFTIAVKLCGPSQDIGFAGVKEPNPDEAASGSPLQLDEIWLVPLG